MTPLVLIRHGVTGWNQEGRIQGQKDIPLSDEGRAQVGGWRLPAAFATHQVLCSPLRRTRETAALLGLTVSRLDDRLMEASWGAWEGRRLVALRTELGPEMRANEALGLDFRPQGGESPRDLQIRLAPLLRDLAAGGRPTLAITHKGVIRALYALATGWDMRDKPADKHQRAAAHQFHITAEGGLQVGTLNIPLTRKADP